MPAAEKPALNIPIDIGPALLLLTHGPFVGVIVAMLTLSYLFFITGDDTRTTSARVFAASTCVWTLLFCAWTIYAIVRTYGENLKVRKPTYGLGGFSALIFLVFILAIFDIWLFVIICTIQ
jgi:hypothetical protein